ncbi:MAG: DUF5060 domain-containing protein [Planctomycetes bacterium]|nr:DUF5060 domain-containing protein [Planctomycetota bacterium]
MRERLFILFLVLSLTGSAWTDLVGYWPLDGDASDLSVNGNDGTISGNVTPTADRLGNPSGAMSFAGGGSDKIDVGDPPEFNITGAMTITAWVYLDSTSPVHGGRNSRILGKMDGGGHRAWSSGIEASSGGVAWPATVQVSSNGSDVISSVDDASLPLDRWVYYAGVYDPGTSMKVYLDGDLAFNLETGIPASQYSSNDHSVLIGNRPSCGDCGWYGALDEVRLYNEALSEADIEALMGAVTAANPDPQDGALRVDPNSILSWDSSPSATSYDVYLGTDPGFTGETPVSPGQSGASYNPDPNLLFATTYYWRIDVHEGGQIYESSVWSFTTQGLASDPVPADEATLVDNNDTTLTWTGDDAAVSYDIYLGKNESSVASASHPAGDINGTGPVDLLDLKVLYEQWLSPGSVTPSANLDGIGNVDLYDFGILANDWLGPFQGNQTSATFDPGDLEANTTYYWRIDEVNDSEPGSPWKGPVWSFTTKPGAAVWEYEEWTVNNPSWSGNAYDVVATVTFTHTNTGSTHTTEMFYDGSNTWKFRFAGTKTGEWTFLSSSLDSDLNGLTGSITIPPNPNPDARGFLTTQGTKYAIQVGNSGQLKGYRLNMYMNGQDFPAFITDLTSADTINAYIADARQYDFDTIFVHVCNNWFDFGSPRWDEHNSENPDPQTFAALENLIAIARSRGMRVQIWSWGDEARRWTPIGAGGINGIPDRRLQRYIAARLGPLPGWTMGYGFDLQEWVSESQVGSWAQYLHQHFGWRHLVWARGRSHSELDVKSYSGKSDGGQPFSYDDAVSKLNSDLTRPHLYEERFSYLREGAWTMENTRRALWHYTLAGGMGSWWGFYRLGVAESPLPPYPNPEQLVTVNQFWAERFLLDMARANNLTDGYCLKTTANDNYIFYKENTTSIQINLSDAAAALPAIAVDTKLDYVEINVGALDPVSQTWTAPYVSDWALSVGDFD